MWYVCTWMKKERNQTKSEKQVVHLFSFRFVLLLEFERLG